MATRFRISLYLLLTLILSPDMSRTSSAIEWLPDLIVPASYLYDYDIKTNIIPGRRHIRLSNGTANVGEGPLHLYGVLPSNGDGTQNINQRVFYNDGTWRDIRAGVFVFHPGHDHIHVQDWCAYRLREIVADSGVGAILAEGAKTSFCILDLSVHNSSLPNFDPDGNYNNCGSTIQGLSVGWVDIYHKELAGQNIDITGIPDGTYWLESEVDPENKCLELSESNNVTRIQVTVGSPGAINPDEFEPNESFSQVLARPEGGINSPNLGPCGPQLVLDSLTLHDFTSDYYRFYLNHTATLNDFVKVQFNHGQGDVDLILYDSAFNQLVRSESTSDSEYVGLASRPEGWYYVRVYGFGGATSPNYRLTIDPPANWFPSITLNTPPSGNTTVLHGVETYQTTWNYSDPENDLCWVTLFADLQPVHNNNEILLPTSMHTPAAAGSYIINTASLAVGTYWLYGEVTDGGTKVGSWSAGTLTLYPPGLAGSLGGTISGFQGALLDQVTVSLSQTSQLAFSDSTGYFWFSQLVPRDYQVTLTHPRYFDTTVSAVAVDSTDTTIIQVVMSPKPSTMSGKVTTTYGLAIPGVQVSVNGQPFVDMTDSAGQYAIAGVLPGTVSLTFTHEYYEDTTITGFGNPGDTTTLNVSLIEICPYLAGDLNDDEGVDIADLTILIDHLFISLDPITDPLAANVDGSDDEVIDISDLTYLITFLFLSGPEPVCN